MKNFKSLPTDKENIILKDKNLKKDRWKSYFRLNTQRITIMAMLLAFNLFLSWLSVILFSLIPIYNFLRIEISFFSFLICWKLINGFYAMLLVFPATWMRFIGIDPLAEPIGVLAMNLSDSFSLGMFILFAWIFRTKVVLKVKYGVYIKLLIVSLIVISLTSLWNTFLNFSFLLKLYGAEGLKTLPFALILIGFNYLKFTLNYGIFISIYKTIDKIAPRDF
ncbi:hypothetical protein [Spiroplasma apis]|uniref:ECF transporter S component n=1 Tax=Spiroplasma apis B31 TaxID=1276258 RepID=V5RI57_SPIAP|nr:hypothetical protein [Spiroplasma apis]AHB36143.1 hypothetical protein SAPIS_v1c02970 [Spiroplasma apis B31]